LSGLATQATLASLLTELQLKADPTEEQLVSAADKFGVEVSRGNITGFSAKHKFGLNQDVDTADAPEDVWNGGGLKQPADQRIGVQSRRTTRPD
jgi:hypothetical protein